MPVKQTCSAHNCIAVAIRVTWGIFGVKQGFALWFGEKQWVCLYWDK